MKSRAVRNRRIQACGESPGEYKGMRADQGKVNSLSYLQAEYDRAKKRIGLDMVRALSGPVRILFKDGKAVDQCQ